MAQRPGSWVSGFRFRLALLGATSLGALLTSPPAVCAVSTGHLATDAEVRALVVVPGGAFRFAAEARQEGEGAGRLEIRPQPETVAGGPSASRALEPLKSGQPIPFSLTFDGQSRVTWTVTPRQVARTVISTFRVLPDLTELFLRAEAPMPGSRVTLTNLVLKGAAIPGGADASGDLDILRIRGAALAGGFTLSGTITATWPQPGHGSAKPGLLDVQIWGAKVVDADTTPPHVSIRSPAPGSLLAMSIPAVAASYSDSELGASGIDLASVRLEIDGFDETSQATIGPAGLNVAALAPLGEGSHSLAVLVKDRAGNEGQAAIAFTTDTAGPAIVVSSPAATVVDDPSPAIALTFTDAVSGPDPASFRASLDGQELTARCAATAGGVTCAPPPMASGAHTLSFQLRDRAGNLTSAEDRFSLDLDDVPPELAVAEPAAPTIVGREALHLRFSYRDLRSGVDPSTFGVEIDGQDVRSSCRATPTGADCPPPTLARGSHLLTARVADRRGNRASAQAAFTLALPLEVAFTSPEAESFSAAPVVRLEGTLSPEATRLRVNGQDAVVHAGAFVVESFPLRDGLNNLVAIAEDGAGNTGTATLRLEADRTPPRLSVMTPTEGMVLSTTEVAVSGRVNDLVTGTVGDQEVTVTVNGVEAAVSQRGFLAPAVPLVPGPNTLRVVATDRGGNRTEEDVAVVYEPPGAARSLRALSGSGQSGPIGTRLAEPFVVAVTDEAGQPAAGVRVIFRVVGGSGTLENGRRGQAVTTDASGQASLHLTLGSRAGAATDRVRAAIADYAGEAQFVANARPGAAAAIDVAVGDTQVAALGTLLAQPLVALLTDGEQNPIVGATVTFRSVRGDGRFPGGSPSGSTEIEIQTDESGLATVPFTLGAKEGWDAYLVEASFAGMTTLPASFRASGFLAQDPAATRVSGVVLDNEDRPIPGVTLRLRGTAQTTQAEPTGRFTLSGVPPGQAFLIADGSTTTRSGAWPTLEFELFAVAGIDNTLPKPIYLLPLDLNHGIVVDETRGGTVTIPELPGFSLEVAPGSVTFPSGSRSGLISVTPVHADKVPMAPGSGMQPRLIVTIQPAGARFDPPAILTLPNIDALPPGTVTEMFSFDHDIGAFVSIGTGTVSEDGRVLRSDPGFGVVEAGWHCGARQTESGGTASLGLTIAEKPEEPVVLLIGGGGGADKRILHAIGKPPIGLTYSWTVANPEIVSLFPQGSPLCADLPICPTEAQARGVGTTNARVEISCPATGKTKTEEIRVVAAKVHLKEVSFSGATYREVVEDGTGTPYLAPHWQDNTNPLDGDAADIGDRRFPVSFEQNGKISVGATWTIEPQATPGSEVFARGTVSNPAELEMAIPRTKVSVTNGLIRLGVTEMTGQLPPGIGFLNPLQIDWQISMDGGETWGNAGRSETRAYVVLRRIPLSPPPYETLYDIACRNAHGKTDDASATAAIWLDFKDPLPGVRRKPRDGYNFLDGKQMTYWIKEDAARADIERIKANCQKLAGMLLVRQDPADSLLDGVGTCDAWAKLLLGSLRTTGISASLIEVTAKQPSAPFPNDPEGTDRTRAELLISEWNLLALEQPAPPTCGGFGVFIYDPEGPDLRQPGIPAQGVPNPFSNFLNHFIVSVNGKYYDPSYGTGPFTGDTDDEAHLAWEKSALEGFWWYCIKGARSHVVKAKNTREIETNFIIKANQ